MDLEPGMTKQGVRDLNSLYPKKRKARPGEEPRGPADAVPVPAPAASAAEAAAVAPPPLP
jgi:hypothetical protein